MYCCAVKDHSFNEPGEKHATHMLYKCRQYD